MSRQQIHPYLPLELHKRLRAYCAARGVTETSVVQAALKDYLDDTNDKTLLMRRLDRMSRALDRVQRDQDITAEAIAVFVQVWLGYAPRLEGTEREAARRSGNARYQQFLEEVARRYAAGSRLVDDIVKDRLVDPAELEAAAATGEGDEA